MFRFNRLFRTLPENRKGTDYFIGDLHGQRERLSQALAERQFDPTRDRVISVGDLIDRGPDSPGCIALLEEPWFHACLGNHEWLLINAVLGGDPVSRQVHQDNGGEWVEDCDPRQLERWAQQLQQGCPLALEVPWRGRLIGVTHNDVLQNDWRVMRRKASRRLVDRCVWSRARFHAALGQASGTLTEPLPPIAGVDVVVAGHNPWPEPVWAANQVYIDTLWKSDRLTVVSAEDLLRRV